MTDDLHWYCLRTKPKTERITSTILRSEAELEVFCPFIRFERARRSGRLWVTEAMFPGMFSRAFDICPNFGRFRPAVEWLRL